MLTVRQVQTLLGAAKPDLVLAHIYAGRLKAIDIGTGKRACWRISPADFEAFVRFRTSKPPTPPVKRRRSTKSKPDFIKYFS